jgi:hypothetical protein
MVRDQVGRSGNEHKLRKLTNPCLAIKIPVPISQIQVRTIEDVSQPLAPIMKLSPLHYLPLMLIYRNSRTLEWLGGVNLGSQLRERHFLPRLNLYGINRKPGLRLRLTVHNQGLARRGVSKFARAQLIPSAATGIQLASWHSWPGHTELPW